MLERRVPMALETALCREVAAREEEVGTAPDPDRDVVVGAWVWDVADDGRGVCGHALEA